jgi:hypothetical protein
VPIEPTQRLTTCNGVARGSRSAFLIVLDGLPVFTAFEVLVAHGGSFEGTPTELFDTLGQIARQRTMSTSGWPKSPIALSMLLKTMAPQLREIGVSVEFA